MAAFLALNAVHVTAAWARSQSAGPGSGTNSFPAAPLSAQPGDTVAYAVPRNAPLADEEVILPQPLPPSAVAQYGRIMALQASGDYREADALISRLDDTTLVGPILADRYLSNNYISSRAELSSWLKQYGAQPAAPAIYTLLKQKSPRSAVLPPTPRPILLPETTMTAGAAARPSLEPDGASWRRIFMAGLNDWQRGDIAQAQPLFVRAANMNSISDDSRAAADFWAARAALRQQQPENYLNWLRLAAATNDTFYGMLAGRLLGEGFGGEDGDRDRRFLQLGGLAGGRDDHILQARNHRRRGALRTRGGGGEGKPRHEDGPKRRLCRLSRDGGQAQAN